MLLTPTSARPWLGPDSRNRPWPGHGAMMIRRREALGALYAAYGSWARFALGALAWALGVAGAFLVGRGIAGSGAAQTAGIGLLVVATFLGGAVVATGSGLARATAGWLTLATAVTADGGRVDAAPGPETLRAHEEAVRADRAAGRGELWRLPLVPRTVAVAVLAGAGVVLAVQAFLGYGEASTPYAGDDLRGTWLAQVLTAAVCLLAAALTASGLRRVHRARMHRAAHDEPAQQASSAGSLTPAVGSGAIVVGGTLPPPGTGAAPPSWAGPLSAASSDAAPGAAQPPAAAGGGEIRVPPGAAGDGDTASSSAAAAGGRGVGSPAAARDGEAPPAAGEAAVSSAGAGGLAAAVTPAAGEAPVSSADAGGGDVTAPHTRDRDDAMPDVTEPGAAPAFGTLAPPPGPSAAHPGAARAAEGPSPATPAAAEGRAEHAGPRPTVTPRVRLSDGRELAPGTTLVGRAPRPRPDEHADAVLAVADERVSKTHLTVRVETGRVVVVDRGSTNGTIVHAPGGASRPLTPGEPAELTDGDVVVLGSTTLTVGEVSDDVEHTVLRDPAGR